MEALPELDEYELGNVIGRGGMGEVVVAFDRQMEREVALKRMRARPTAEMVERFVREAKVQARLDHPAIVPVHTLGRDRDGNPYFTMKRLVGATLADALAKDDPIHPLLRAFVDVCFAIQLAHERGVVHRDLKPTNIMLGNYGDVYVIDWGVARILGDAPQHPTTTDEVTAMGVMLGTPGYMAPEQMVGGNVGPPADVFSLGAILFEILAGEPLHPHGPAAISSTMERPGDSPARRAADRSIPPELDELCSAALAKDPTDRPTARELAHRVQRYLDGDRDLVRRQALARQQLELARAALADPARRGEAGQAATRALALDPESRDAAQLVAQMILEPPSELPRELIASLEASDRELNRQRTLPAAYAYLSLFIFVPVFLILRNVENVFELVMLYVAATAMAALLLYDGRTSRTPVWLFLLANFTFALMFMRLSGFFVLGAALVCGQALGLAARSRVAKKPWLLVLWIVVTMLLPFALEYFGALPRTWWMKPDGLLSRGTILHTGGDLDALFVAISQTVLVMVVGFFSLSITRARETAQRKAHIQAWHLHQLIPRASVR